MARQVLIADVIRIHDQYLKLPDTLPLVLADGYLFAHSDIFRNIRTNFLDLGYKYSSEPPFPYLGAPLLSLSKILKTRIVPFIDNVSILKEAITLNPSGIRRRHFLDGILGANYILHESAHCIAHSILIDDNSAPLDPRDRMFFSKTLLAEAFASACETMLATSFKNSPFNELVVGKSSYMPLMSPFKNVKNKIGQRKLLEFLTVSFLYSNFLYVGLSRFDLYQIFDFLEIDRDLLTRKSLSKEFTDIKKHAFRLSTVFRIDTTGLFFETLGYKEPITKLLNFDPIDFFTKHAEFRNQFNVLIDAAQMSGLFKKINLLTNRPELKRIA
jgi:hypothetical protein